MTAVDQSRTATLPDVPIARKRNAPNLMRQQRIWGWIFLSPWLFGFTVFTAAPIVFSLILTFTNFNLGNPDQAEFVGLKNWNQLLGWKQIELVEDPSVFLGRRLEVEWNDPLAHTALGVTIKFAAVAVPFGLLLPLGLATLLNSKALKGKRLWRLLFYMPFMVPVVSSIFIWQSFLGGQTGWLNRLLRTLGVVDPPNWLQDGNTILFGFMLMGIWGAGNAMLTLLATMQGVPTELYEAADVDGANGWTKWRKITLPMISPVIFYNLVLSVIFLMQYFEVPYIVTRGTGQPGNSAYFFNMHLFKTSFTFFDMGYGATQAWLIFIIAISLTIFLFATSRRWVYYASGD
jgi:multiple sugar transport system permease protein